MTTSIRFRVATLGVAAALALGAVPFHAAIADEEPAPTPAPVTPEEEAPEEEAPAEEEAPEPAFPWMADYAAAQAKAKAENKDLFINFTGSDWCGWCIKLDNEVFSQGDFATKAAEKFVFVYLDFPRSPDLLAKVVDVKKRDELKARYGVQGFPTIMLTFADGTPYASTGYQEGGPEAYLEHLTELRGNSEKARVLATKGEKASVEEIKAAVPMLAEAGFLEDPTYAWVVDRIPQIDPDGKAGLLEIRAAYLDRSALKKMMAEIVENKGTPKDWNEVYEKLKSIDAKHVAKTREEGLYLNLYYGVARWLVDEGRHEDARTAIGVLAAHPLLAEDERAQGALNALLEQIDAAENPEPEPEADGDGDDADDEEPAK
ncbi:MAG: thioredoxin family protein [Planctomycetota bacterium]